MLASDILCRFISDELARLGAKTRLRISGKGSYFLAGRNVVRKLLCPTNTSGAHLSVALTQLLNEASIHCEVQMVVLLWLLRLMDYLLGFN